METMNNNDDAHLVRRVWAGEKEAFEMIVYRYEGALQATARAYCDNADDAADAVQNALLLAYRHLGQLQQPERLGPWLHRVTINACRQNHRRHKPVVSLDAAGDLGREETAAVDDRLLLEQALRCLSPQTRLTVSLYYRREMSLQEIAYFLEVPETTIKSRLRNARARLRKELETIMEQTPLDKIKTARRGDLAPRLLRRLDSVGEVWHIAFSPDGSRVVTVAVLEVNEEKFDTVIACWEGGTGDLLWTVPHTSWAFQPTFLPDSGRVVVSAGLPGQRGGREGQILVLDTATGTVVRTIGNVPAAKCIAVSPDGRQVAVGGQEEYETYRASGQQGMAVVYELATGEPVSKVAPHLNYVTSIAFAPDGATFATGSHLRDADPEAANVWRGGDVRVWDTRTGERIHRLVRPNDTGCRHNIAFSPDGTLLAAPDGREGDVLLWDTASGALVRTRPGNGEPAFALIFSPDGATLAAGYGDNAVRLWEPRTGRQRHALTQFGQGVYALAFSPEGTTLATADKNGLVQFWAL